MNNFSAGTDPEFFVIKNGEIVPFLLDDPINIEGFVEIHADNVLLEMNTAIAVTKQEFLEIHRDSMALVSEFIKKEFDMTLAKVNSHEFKNCKHPQFGVFGCEPSYNLYDKDLELMNPLSNFRYAGGHFHIGIKGDETFYRKIINNCDYHVGLNLEEAPSDRRKYYGRAGEYRFSDDFKVEYRTPANDWCFGREEWMYDQIQKAVNDTLENKFYEFDYKIINSQKVLEC